MSVTVVVPYFRQQEELDLVLAALDLQTHDGFEVVVADDGSPEPPSLGAHSYPVRLVRQEDRGFRAAAARNLAVREARGDLLCFLDADTIPEPGYLAAVVGAVGRGADLVVGRRRHAELDGWTPDRLTAWFDGDGPAPAELEEPQWLIDAFRRTDDLAEAGDDAYRFVIAAVLSVPRSLFDAVGGFEEAFTEYGGEDWEFARRCWLAGATFAHEPTAVAWHDGPDFAGRDLDRVAAKNAEALALARFVTEPAARGGGLWWEQPDVVVTLDDRGAEPAAVLLSVQSLLAGTDAAVWLASGAIPAPLAGDPRVRVGAPSSRIVGRCRYQVDVERPLVLRGTTLREAARLAPARGDGIRLDRTRDLARPGPVPGPEWSLDTELLDRPDLGRVWGRQAKDA